MYRIMILKSHVLITTKGEKLQEKKVKNAKKIQKRGGVVKNIL